MLPLARRAALNPVVASVLLLVVYIGLSFANDERGYLGTDTGGKVATLVTMAAGQGTDPDIGYWAEEWDPSGRLHPLFYTRQFGDRWVNVTTLPMVELGAPLFDLGGYRTALLIPMMGGVAAALAARALSRRLGAGEPMVAFWLVGLASPVLIYALDFWEHVVGVALVGWAAAALGAVIDGHRRALIAAGGAGVLLGVDFTMRTEALVFATTLTGAACIVVLRSAGLRRAVATGAIAVVGFAVPVAVNHLAESALLSESARLGRAEHAAEGVTRAPEQSLPGSRVGDALTMTFNLVPSLSAGSQVFGVLGIASLGAAAALAAAADRNAARRRALVVLAAVGASVFLLRLVDGPGFVPGLFAAAPVAVVGAVLGWRDSRARPFVLASAAAIPVVWLTGYVGGAVPQWGGRYLLPAGLILTAAGVARLGDLPRWLAGLFVGLAVGITAFGMVWMVERTHTYADTSATLNARTEPVLVSGIAHLVREGGWFYGDRNWLTATDLDQLALAGDVIREAGFDEFGLVRRDATTPPPPVEGFVAGEPEPVPFFPESRLEITTYRAEDG